VVEIEYNTVRESDKGSVFVYINGKPYKVNYVGQNEYQSPGVITTKVAVPVQLKKGAHTIMLDSGSTYMRPTALKIKKAK
jgi:hypothetical protein